MATVINMENIQRSHLRVDTRKWIAPKMRPKKYGDSTNVKITGGDGTPPIFKVIYEKKKLPYPGDR